MNYLQKAYISNLNVVCREGNYFCLQPGQSWNIRTHGAPFHKFYFFLEGHCQITIENQIYDVSPGDWFFIPAGTHHSYTELPETGFTKHWIHFDLYPNDSLPQLLHLTHRIQEHDLRETAEMFAQLSQYNASNSLTDMLRAKAALLALLCRYIDLSGSDSLPVLSEEDRRINEVLTYIHKHLSQPLSNDLLASLCHLHPNHFIRFFAKKTGQSPASYVLRRRMELARQLLIQSDLPVSHIAEQVGLPDQSHFSRLFRNTFAMTPTQCRKQHKTPVSN